MNKLLTSPVVVAIAGSRVGGSTVEIAVGDGHTPRSAGTQDNVLAADLGGLFQTTISVDSRHDFDR